MCGVLGFEPSLDADDLGAPPWVGLAALPDEFVDIVGPMTAAWLLISWPRVQGLLPPRAAPPASTVPRWRVALPRFGDAARYQTPAAQNAQTSASDSSNS
jgi:hypothetical protein